MINGIHHTTIATEDLDRLRGFYEGLMGFEVRWEGSWEAGSQIPDEITGLKDSAARFCMLWTGNSYLELFQFSSPEPIPPPGFRRACDPGFTHVCFDVTDIYAEYRRLSAAGIEFLTDPKEVLGVRSTYGRDPDGNLLELQEVVDHEVIRLPGQPSSKGEEA